MEQTNYQELNKKLFSDYTADPSALGSGDSIDLEQFLEQFPYCQLLHSFYARSLSVADQGNFEKQLSKTALFSPDRKVLFTIIKEAEKLKDPEIDSTSTKEQIIETGAGNTGKTAQGADQGDDIHAYQTQETDPEIAVQDPSAGVKNENFRMAEAGTAETLTETSTELDNLIKGSAVQADYLAEEKVVAPGPEQPVNMDEAEDNKPLETASEAATEAGDQKVSKYDDDKLPYSFLWWLDKTRKEHSDTYQPYLSFKLDTSQNIKRGTVDQLSSQIIENIFHLQSPIDQLENAPRTVPFQVKRKEDYILEKFIKEEPQIKPPNSQKLDTENKARKSAEDPNDLVSETLAQIYTDQMLFHKAIDTYKKLSLKFPEKSAYFDDQIRELEKKVN